MDQGQIMGCFKINRKPVVAAGGVPSQDLRQSDESWHILALEETAIFKAFLSSHHENATEKPYLNWWLHMVSSVLKDLSSDAWYL